MKELALHLMDIAENSVTANSKLVQISIVEDPGQDQLTLTVQDDGKGMDAETASRAVDPFHTSRTTRKVGLGLPLLKAAAQACYGDLWIDSKPGIGTKVYVEFQRSHIDRMPLGDLESTFLSLLVAHPEINWVFNYSAASTETFVGQSFAFDSRPVKAELGTIPFTEPDVLTFLRNWLSEGIDEIKTHLSQADLFQQEHSRIVYDA